ncbi:MAG: helix-turn-helix transcriptional regulator [Tepidisphaeraceae bacterium]
MNDRNQTSSSLSAKIIAYLCERGHTQAQVARMLGVSDGFISLVKSRERSLTIAHLERLAEALSVPLGALLVNVTDYRAGGADVRKFMDLSAKIMEKADVAQRAIFRGAATSSR